MREIKFRAWYPERRMWIRDIRPMQTSFTVDYKYVNEELIPIDSLIFMEYTGLKDKNGKEIYAGDIIKYKRKCFQICWGPPTFYLQDLKDDEEQDPYNICYIVHHSKVIGNIYENPELLENK